MAPLYARLCELYDCAKNEIVPIITLYSSSTTAPLLPLNDYSQALIEKALVLATCVVSYYCA